MIRTELFKLRTHRTPWVLMATLVASLAIAPTYYAVNKPPDTASVTDALVGVLQILAPLLAAVFGGWLVGHEFRQGTLRRVLGTDARRGRLIATKAAVGVAALAAALAIAAAMGALGSAASVSSFGESIVWDGVFRDVLSAGFLAFVTAAIAFGLSILFRSDTYGMVGAISLVTIIAPLLTLIPKIGKYMPSALATDVTLWISGTGELGVKIVPAALGLTAFFAVLGAAAMVTFQRRDI